MQHLILGRTFNKNGVGGGGGAYELNHRSELKSFHGPKQRVLLEYTRSYEVINTRKKATKKPSLSVLPADIFFVCQIYYEKIVG